MYYLIENNPNRRYDDVSGVLDECVTQEYYMDDSGDFDEYLDEGQSVNVCGYTFSPSEVLRELNYDGYNSEFQYWAESRAENDRDDFRYELERADNGDIVWVCGCQVYCYDECEEEEESYTTADEDDLIKKLEKKLLDQKEAEDLERKEEKIIGDDFLSVLGIQVI